MLARYELEAASWSPHEMLEGLIDLPTMNPATVARISARLPRAAGAAVSKMAAAAVLEMVKRGHGAEVEAFLGAQAEARAGAEASARAVRWLELGTQLKTQHPDRFDRIMAAACADGALSIEAFSVALVAELADVRREAA